VPDSPRAAVGAPTSKTILLAHRQAGVRDRFSVAIADGRHGFVLADTAQAAVAAVSDKARPLDLALVDLGLADDGVALVQTLRERVRGPLPILVFSGSITSAGQIAPLASLVAGYVNEHAITPQILPALAPHLFPDNFNRRAKERVAIGVPISYRSGRTIAAAVTLDVGKGGLGIRTMNPLPKGTIIRVKFRLPGTPSEIDASGQVAWSDGKVGMGVQFDNVTPGDQQSIDTFVEVTASLPHA
jgi:uncharacterized protein (TIGR02266 family)